MLIVGLTGGIACGKSTVSQRLREKHGLDIIDADQIARDVVAPGSAGHKKIVDYFGEKVPDLVATENGPLNRRALGAYVFLNKQELGKLNSIVHPAVRWSMLKKVFYGYVTGKRLVVLDVPLLFESKLDQFCGTTILVTCDLETQLRRLLKRDPDLSLQEAENRINNQMSTELKLQRSEIIIKNESSLDDLNAQVDQALAEITPSAFKTLILLFPPIGFIVAVWVFVLKKIHDRSIGKKEQ